MPDTRPSLIEHAGPWALAKADLGSGGPVPALVSRDRVLDLSARPETAGAGTVTELLERWDAVAPLLKAVAADPQAGWRPLSNARLHSPVEPRQVFQAGANYRTHVIDLAVAHHDGSDGRSTERVRAEAAAAMDTGRGHAPFVFTGLPSAVCGPGAGRPGSPGPALLVKVSVLAGSPGAWRGRTIAVSDALHSHAPIAEPVASCLASDTPGGQDVREDLRWIAHPARRYPS